MAVEQLPLSLPAASPFAADYFVPHSGVADALRCFDNVAKRLSQEEGCFSAAYLFGPSGVGKSHLLSVAGEYFALYGLAPESLFVHDFEADSTADEKIIGELVSQYEERKTKGGLFLLASRSAPERLTQNPHLLSRVKSASIFELRSPSIEELRPTLKSLLERKNLRLSERNIDYLLRRVPTNPLSLWGILARMDDRSLREGRTLGLQFIREILGEI